MRRPWRISLRIALAAVKGDDRVRIAVYNLLAMRYGWGRTLPPLPARLDDAVLDGLS